MQAVWGGGGGGGGEAVLSGCLLVGEEGEEREWEEEEEEEVVVLVVLVVLVLVLVVGQLGGGLVGGRETRLWKGGGLAAKMASAMWEVVSSCSPSRFMVRASVATLMTVTLVTLAGMMPTPFMVAIKLG